jgi:hypothetical protein
MRKLIAIALLALLPATAWGQNKLLSSAPNADSLPVKQLEANIDFLMRELDILHKKILALYPLYVDIAACGAAGQIYSPGAAGFNSKCVPLSGAPFVSEIKATTATNDGDFSAYGSTPSARLQGFINANGCPTTSGWHPCTDDEVIFALDNRVTGATNPTTLITGSDEYWVRSVNPSRFSPSETPGSPLATYSCSGWTSNSGALRGTDFTSAQTWPRFIITRCSTLGKVLCCR